MRTTSGRLSVLISAQLGQTPDKLFGLLSGLEVNDTLQLSQRIGLPGSCVDICLVRLVLLAKVLSQILQVCFFLARVLVCFLVCVITLVGRAVASLSVFDLLALVPSCCRSEPLLFLASSHLHSHLEEVSATAPPNFVIQEVWRQPAI